MTERENARRAGLVQILNIAKANGCEVYKAKSGELPEYGTIIFPDETIMGVSLSFFGYDFTIEYVPSKENGTGCMCNGDDGVTDTIDWAKLLELKEAGLKFARELGAKLYKNRSEWEAREAKFNLVTKA